MSTGYDCHMVNNSNKTSFSNQYPEKYADLVLEARTRIIFLIYTDVLLIEQKVKQRHSKI